MKSYSQAPDQGCRNCFGQAGAVTDIMTRPSPRLTTDRLAEKLARLNINSPKPSRIESPQINSEFILESFRIEPSTFPNKAMLLMNPLSSIKLGLEKHAFVEIQRFLFPIVPDLKCQSGVVKVDPSVLKPIMKENGDTVMLGIVTSPIPNLSKVLVNTESHLSSSEKKKVENEIRQLLVVNADFPYEIYLDSHSRNVQFRMILHVDNVTSETSFGRILKDTKVEFMQHHLSNGSQPLLGGLKVQSQFITEVINLALFRASELAERGIKPPRGILLYGPPGTGKTLLARYISQAIGIKLLSIDASQVLGKFYGDSEALIHKVFTEACDSSPALIFIDEFDSLCPQRDSSSSGADQRIVASLLGSIDKILDRSVFILAATNSINSIDTAFRRPGRFDYEVEVGIPGVVSRYDILETLLSAFGVNSSEIEKIAHATHGFVGADLELLVREACLHSVSSNDKPPLTLSNKDLSAAIAKIKPSGMREVLFEVPKVSWTDIGGQDTVKQLLRESIHWPLQKPEKFKLFNIEPPKGVLLYGPPGCSKTLLAKALAAESGLNFIAIKGPEVFSKWVGDSEKVIKQLFCKARQMSPSIIFFDEFDAIASRRSDTESSVSERVLSQILSELDGAEPLFKDEALLRPGRFDRHIYIPLPDRQTRFEILKIHTSKIPLFEDVDLIQLSVMTEGYSGAEIQALCQEAAISAFRRDKNVSLVSTADFDQAFRTISPRTPSTLLDGYSRFTARYS